MRHLSRKIAITLGDDLYRFVERKRKKSRTTRSGVIQEAVRRWRKQEEEAEKARQYIEGYRRMPETPEEIAEIEAMGKDAMLASDWEWE